MLSGTLEVSSDLFVSDEQLSVCMLLKSPPILVLISLERWALHQIILAHIADLHTPSARRCTVNAVSLAPALFLSL